MRAELISVSICRLLDKILSAFGLNKERGRGHRFLPSSLESLRLGYTATLVLVRIQLGESHHSFSMTTFLEVLCINIVEDEPMTPKGRIIWTSTSLLSVFMSEFAQGFPRFKSEFVYTGVLVSYPVARRRNRLPSIPSQPLSLSPRSPQV